MPTTETIDQLASDIQDAVNPPQETTVYTVTAVRVGSAPSDLHITEQEAQALRDIRRLTGRDDARRKHLKARAFAIIKNRLGVPADRKVSVEIDDTQNPDYLRLKIKPLAEPQYEWRRIMGQTPQDVAIHLGSRFHTEEAPEDAAEWLPTPGQGDYLYVDDDAGDVYIAVRT